MGIYILFFIYCLFFLSHERFNGSRCIFRVDFNTFKVWVINTLNGKMHSVRMH
ncbi:Uncharacterised protein [Serratia quinivorans]|jgi:hypothetical protein|nr:Uncharacterised protein [Serratia quinivorans]CAI1163198.1 Uncharacterised protein [Serratia quinivorans]CAI1909108.1 Uncharacterised protein [Serratia quinivorans]CAI2143894.1 Uncharacterised protein [Serratia quinivorans]CAI2501601.1 Uncharacterised protein [Serratia quinivorans]